MIKQLETKLKLSNLTAIIVDTREHRKAEQTLRTVISNLGCKGIFFTNDNQHQDGCYTTIIIPEIKNLHDYSKFMLRDLYRYIDTEYCLTIQTDGFPINYECWKNDFLKYDYIGSPMPDYSEWLSSQTPEYQEKWHANSFSELNWPQNAGFSIRSKKLMRLTAECPYPIENIMEDIYFNIYYRNWFLDRGVNFGPRDIAYSFSRENPLTCYDFNFENCFGFHGRQSPKHIEMIKNLQKPKESRFRILKRMIGVPSTYPLREFLSLRKKISDPLSLKREDLFRVCRDFDINNTLPADEITIDVAICCIDKDEQVLDSCIRGVKNYVEHKIKNIYLIAPKHSKAIQKISSQEGCILIDEDSILPIQKSDIDYTVKGKDRSGWLFQQFLKLHLDLISDSENVFVIDADTVLIKPKVLISKKKTVFDIADEYHDAYFKTIGKLLDYKKYMKVSCVSHMMILNRKILKDLRKKVEQHTGKDFIYSIVDLIDCNETSFFSEFELYANYFISTFPREFRLRYWRNCSLPSKNIDKHTFFEKLYSPSKINSISYHSYS